jgi:hypothetical protein
MNVTGLTETKLDSDFVPIRELLPQKQSGSAQNGGEGNLSVQKTSLRTEAEGLSCYPPPKEGSNKRFISQDLHTHACKS